MDYQDPLGRAIDRAFFDALRQSWNQQFKEASTQYRDAKDADDPDGARDALKRIVQLFREYLRHPS